jgi:hypothetical protein
VTAVEVTAPGRLVVRYDPHGARLANLAEVARAALEADPHNPAPVTLRYDESWRASGAARREPASTPMVDTQAGIR